MQKTDRVNWIKNLIQVMCCDGSIHEREKRFLAKVAKQLDVKVPDWNALLRSVLRDARVRYPLSDETAALDVLKSLIVMANADGKVDDNERRYILSFAKVIGVSKDRLKTIVKDMDKAKKPARGGTDILSVTPANTPAVLITVASDDFDNLDQFVQVVREQGHDIRVITVDNASVDPDCILCFHAAAAPEDTVGRCRRLLQAAQGPVVAILTRYQGHHVRYLLELGIPKCVIEPVYARDVEQIVALAFA